MHDLVIRGATVTDGLGHDPVRADVAVKDGRIAAIGEVGKDASEIVDAGGLTLMPGIIDRRSCHAYPVGRCGSRAVRSADPADGTAGRHRQRWRPSTNSRLAPTISCMPRFGRTHTPLSSARPQRASQWSDSTGGNMAAATALRVRDEAGRY